MTHFRYLLLAVVLTAIPDRARADEEEAELARYDERTLKDAGIGGDGPALLTFFRNRTLSAGDLRTIQQLIVQLGNEDFEAREVASKKLADHGSSVLPYLRPATNHKDAEVSRRAKEIIAEIEAGPGPALPMAAARQLIRVKLEGAVAVLVNYLPFADDANVGDNVMDAIAVLTPRTGPFDAVLNAALKDPQAMKRAAAGFVLGRRQEEELRREVRKLLTDKEATVRFRAALGLLAGRDKSALPTLIELATEPAGDLTWQAEDALVRLAGGYPPEMPYGDTEPLRKARRERWQSWWTANETKVDLARIEERTRFLNYTLVPEMHANKVWEIGSDGKTVLWEVNVPGCPIDAHVLPGGRFLVAELNAHQVTERDLKGNVLWTHKINTPIACRRLPNGHTFIGTNHSLHVFTRDHNEVMKYEAEPGFFIHSVQWLANGHLVCVSMEGAVREIDAAGKVVRTVPLPIRGSWSGVEGVPGGNYLAVNNAQGKVLEVDSAGKVVWEYTTPGACYASRLPNGNTLVVSNHAGLLEITRERKVVWERKLTTSLWRAHRR